ncbi:hypothetical protein [Alicyclobacillus sp. ALC3]|uniref:hypothetical protein n=1 Tax=Alicyclobacillus sp. ALC3 TaxID=2796143 RepID=UPI002378E502|nr:hypothetical protein [Alicyclobacillus sp. ALC3]WDL97451.1 hypothetical protein JC200_01585 [Alicyclobacillus sp. ALC3]
MLATKLDTAPNGQIQQREYERSRESRQTATRTKTRFDLVSLFGSIVLCAAAGWMLASMSARVATVNAQVVQLQSQIQQVSAVNASYSASLNQLTQPTRILALAAANGLKPGQPVTIPTQGSSAPN